MLLSDQYRSGCHHIECKGSFKELPKRHQTNRVAALPNRLVAPLSRKGIINPIGNAQIVQQEPSMAQLMQILIRMMQICNNICFNNSKLNNKCNYINIHHNNMGMGSSQYNENPSQILKGWLHQFSRGLWNLWKLKLGLERWRRPLLSRGAMMMRRFITHPTCCKVRHMIGCR